MEVSLLSCNISLTSDENPPGPEQQVQRTYADTLETEDFTFFGYGEDDLQEIASTSATSSRNVSLKNLEGYP